MKSKLILKSLILLLVGFNSTIGFSQAQVAISDKTKISLLTVDVSSEIHTLYGHTALRIQDVVSDIDVVYNYGMFDFNTENFALKFIKGDLQYYAAVYPYKDFEYSYQEENRTFYEQELNLTFEEKKALFQKLNTSIFSNERFYTYKFIDRNCTTKVIDVLNSVLKDRPIVNTVHQGSSYRTVLFDYQKNHFYLNLGINSIFGHRPDENASILFLPLDFMEVIKNTKHNGKPLASPATTIYKAQQNETHSYWDSIYSLIVVLAFFALVNKKGTNLFYFILLGLIGLFFSMVGLYSLHQEVLWNYNIMLFNPVFLFLAYFIVKDKSKWINKTSLIGILCLIIYVFYMLNKAHLILVSPIILTTFYLLLRLYLTSKRNLN